MAEVSWKTSTVHNVLWHSFDEEHLFYNVGSSDTHLLTNTAKEILDLLSKRSLTLSGLANELGLVKDNFESNFTAELESLLIQLKTIHLVEATQP
ncbi:hypothetical protein N9063_00980 [Deltaproteobacteria bacterium]|nr:hypothetical protein [Deltaproteobacteria bacterium]